MGNHMVVSILNFYDNRLRTDEAISKTKLGGAVRSAPPATLHKVLGSLRGGLKLLAW